MKLYSLVFSALTAAACTSSNPGGDTTSTPDGAVGTDARTDALTDAGTDAASPPPIDVVLTTTPCANSLDCVSPLIDGGSPPGGPVCVNNHCGCRESADCQAPGTDGPVCDSRAGRCVQCASSRDCDDQRRNRCVAFECVECASAADCASSTHGHACLGGGCGCGSNTDCPGGANCIQNSCVTRCRTNADCTDGFAGVCDTRTGICVVCLADRDCAGMAAGYGAHCFPTTHECGCVTNADCAASNSGRVCDADSMICGCSTDADCPTSKPMCDRFVCRR